MPTFVPHKYGGTYTQAEIDHAAVWGRGGFNPEEYAAIWLDQEISKVGNNAMRNFPFEFPNERFYSKVFEQLRELQRLGLPVNLHSATLTLLPNLVWVTADLWILTLQSNE